MVKSGSRKTMTGRAKLCRCRTITGRAKPGACRNITGGQNQVHVEISQGGQHNFELGILLSNYVNKLVQQPYDI